MIDKLDFIIMKNLHSVKDNLKRIRRQATHWEKIFAKDTSDEGLLSKIYREFLKLNKETNNSIYQWARTLTHTSSKKI